MEAGAEIDIFGFDIGGDKLFFCAYEVNGIFQIDMQTGKVKYLTMSEKYDADSGYLYQDAKIDGEKIWFSPYGADNILVYNSTLNVCEYIDVPQIRGNGRDIAKFYGIYDCGKWFVLLPVEYPAILKVDKETYKIAVVHWEDKFVKEYPNFIYINGCLSIAWDFEIVNEKIFLLAGNTIIKYNVNTDDILFYQIDKQKRMYTGIVSYENKFFLIDRLHSELMMWDEENNHVEKIDIDLGYSGKEAGDDGCPLGLFSVKEGIVIVQAKADYLLLVNKVGMIRKIDLHIKRSRMRTLFFSRVKQCGSELVLPLDGQNKVLLINTNDWTQKCIEMNLENLNFENIRVKIETEDCIMENRVYYGLVNFIDNVKRCREEKNDDDIVYNAGKCIFQTMY